MYIEVAGDYKFTRCGGPATERKELNSYRKKREKGLEKEDDEGGR